MCLIFAYMIDLYDKSDLDGAVVLSQRYLHLVAIKV